MNHNKARKIRMAKRVAHFKVNQQHFVCLTYQGVNDIRKYIYESYRSKVTTRTKFVVLGRDKDHDFVVAHEWIDAHSARSAKLDIPVKYKGHCLYVRPVHIRK